MKHNPIHTIAFHGGEEIPAGTFHGGLIQCPKCKHWFAIDGYRWRTHRC